MDNRSRTLRICVVAVMGAVATVLEMLNFNTPFMPGFISMDFSDMPALLAAFSVGPMGGFAVCLIKNLVKALSTSTGYIGELSNFIIGVFFTVPAGFIYKYNRTKKGAMISLAAGTVLMAGCSLLTNRFIMFPLYSKAFFNGDMNPIVNMYTVIYSKIDTLWKALLFCNTPFNLIKGIIVSVMTMLVYKPMSRIIQEIGKKR